MSISPRTAPRGVQDDRLDGPAAWWRLVRALAYATCGSVGMWSVVVALPSVSAEFGTARSLAAVPYTAVMAGFAVGGIAAGRLADRFGVFVPALGGAILLSLGYVAASLAPGITGFALAHGLLIGLGASVSFAPLMADISLWFVRKRGLAVALIACGNYLGGAIWPPIVQHLVADQGWRQAHFIIAAVTAIFMIPLAMGLRGVAPAGVSTATTPARARQAPMGPRMLQVLLVVAGIACCVAMAMPQVHIVAYCGDLGYGAARGAEMLSMMLGFGIVSRVGSGFVADRIGGIGTLLLGSLLQGTALLLYLMFDGLGQLYVISALFGLFQGGIVPSYAIIVREYFPANEAGTRISICIMATLLGMALGGWMSGAIFDATGSYAAAFLNGIGWNLLNGAIATFLLLRGRGRRGPTPEPRMAPALA